ncbi:MAG: protease modulator HflC [Pseudomonadota bacterium]
MSFRSLLMLILVAATVLLVANSVYTVKETERAIKLRFGAVEEADVPPGLHFKLPIAEEIRKFDARVLTQDAEPQRYYSLEKKPLIVDSFAKWRIRDVGRYYTATSGDERRGRMLLAQRVDEGLRNQISRRDMHSVVSGERDELMQELTSELNESMQADVGVEVIDVRVKKIDLPQEVSAAVYDRMNSERHIEAQQHRAQGQERALGIRADADRQVVVLEAEAYGKAEQIRGDGDAKAAEIYAGAFNQDPEFYEFYRSINAYTNVFGNDGDLLVVDPNSEFFKYLKDAQGGE